jgi:hypothetical protein
VLAGYDNGDVKMFDLRMNKVMRARVWGGGGTSSGCCFKCQTPGMWCARHASRLAQ